MTFWCYKYIIIFILQRAVTIKKLTPIQHVADKPIVNLHQLKQFQLTDIAAFASNKERKLFSDSVNFVRKFTVQILICN